MRLMMMLMIMAASGPAIGQGAPQLSPDQKGYIAYDQCMMHAAIQASHTDARDEDIFSLARTQCATTRAMAIAGQESNKTYLAALDAADADKAQRFPAWIKGVRERRKAFEAGITPAAKP